MSNNSGGSRREREMIPVIVCGGTIGRAVIYCRVDAIPEPGAPVVMRDARMVLRWDGPGLFAMASSGPVGNTRITSAVAEVRDTCRQVLTVSEHAAAALDRWPNA